MPGHALPLPLALLLACVSCGQTSSQTPSDAQGGGESGEGGETCFFEDLVVDAAVQQKLGVAGSVSLQAAAGLEELVARGASSLSGIECLVGLKALIVTHGSVVDLAPASGLLAIERVQLLGNEIVDLSPLSGLSQLEQIDVRQNRVASIANFELPPLQGCSELRLEDNPVGAEEVATACSAGWPVTWGEAAARGACNATCLH